MTEIPSVFHSPTFCGDISLTGMIAVRDAQIELLLAEVKALQNQIDVMRDGVEAQQTSMWLSAIIPSDEGDVNNVFALSEQSQDEPMVGLLRAIIARIEADDAPGAVTIANEMIIRLSDI